VVDIVPTGIEIEKFASGDGIKFRNSYGIPLDAFVLGMVSRLAPEKNLDFMGLAVKQYLQNNSKAVFLLIGSGPSEQKLKKMFETEKMQRRFFDPGALLSQTLIDAYHAIDLFVFTSKTETQGLVVTEAMAAGVPVVAIDGPGIGEVVTDRKNGRLLKNENVEEYCEALQWVFDRGNHKRQMLKLAAKETAAFFSQQICAMRAVEIYKALLEKKCVEKDRFNCAWARAKRFMRVELELLKNRTRATGAALKNGV
jgi:glycosyltransferase involved in cell wall biosynthesis